VYTHVRHYNGAYPTTQGVCYNAFEWSRIKKMFMSEQPVNARVEVGTTGAMKLNDGYSLFRTNVNGDERSLTITSDQHKKIKAR
jgi:hypothetical protein